MKLLAECGLVLAFFSAFMWGGRVSYACVPYEPKEDCQTGIYQVKLYESMNDRNPLAIADAHCVLALPGRIKAETVRFSVYDRLTKELREVEFMESVEFPIKNAEICRLK